MFGSHIYKKPVRIEKKNIFCSKPLFLQIFSADKENLICFQRPKIIPSGQKPFSYSEKYRQCNVRMSVVPTLFCYFNRFLFTGSRSCR